MGEQHDKRGQRENSGLPACVVKGRSNCVCVGLCVSVCVTHLDVSNKELCWCFHWRFGINDLLNGTSPVHCLIEVLGVQPVAVFAPIYCDAPVAWEKKRLNMIGVYSVAWRKIGKRTVKCSRHGTLCVSGVTRPDFLSQFYCGSKVRLRGTSDHAKTKQAVIPLMSKGMRVKALSVSPLDQPA